MNMCVLDTHTLVWFYSDPEKLSIEAKKILQQLESDGGMIVISTITLVELLYIYEKGKITSDLYTALMHSIEEKIGNIRILPIDPSMLNYIASINREQVPDMPDRIIAGLSLALDAPLLSKDRKIRTAMRNVIW